METPTLFGPPSANPRHDNPFAPQTTHVANGHAPSSSTPPPQPSPTFPPSQDPIYGPHGPKSLSGISLRAFLLGLCLGTSLPLTFLAFSHSSPLWRAPFFLATLTIFHFLEYYTTARYNPSAANISAFLLSQNGSAYNIAHSMAFAECFLRHYFFAGRSSWVVVPEWADMAVLGLGIAMLIVGQATRTMAMVQAGSNFNHLVQMKRKQGHELVTDGIYAWLRHPSYFGFWWWGLGTQVVLGNWVCLVGYVVVLWRFFSGRIEKEEELLVSFFGGDYVRYRARTRVRIPFIH